MACIQLTPRLLSKQQAATYCGLSPAAFDRWRKDGRMPNAIPGSARWDRVAIDLANTLSKLGKMSDTVEAPKPEADPLDEWRNKREERRNKRR